MGAHPRTLESPDGKMKSAGGKEERTVAIDPVCKMDVDPKTAPAKTEYKGTTYYFCNLKCKERFEKDPERFLRK